MKTLLLASALAAASLVPAYADFHPATPFQVDKDTNLECSIVGQWPTPQRDPDPVYKINIDLQLDDNGRPTNLGVYHTTRSGKSYDRSEQYTNGNVWQTSGKLEWYWSGLHVRGLVQRMVGELYHNDRDGWMYLETITKNNRVEYRMLADCHPMPEGD